MEIFYGTNAGGEGKNKLTYLVILYILNFNHYFKLFSILKQRAAFNRLGAKFRLVSEASVDSKGHSRFVPRAVCLQKIEPFRGI
jgi:hypothetical protein